MSTKAIKDILTDKGIETTDNPVLNDDGKKIVEKHAGKEVVYFATPLQADSSKVRTALMKAVGGKGIVTNIGVFLTPANGTPAAQISRPYDETELIDEPVPDAPALDTLLAAVTPENVHPETPVAPAPEAPPVITDVPDPIEALVDKLATNPQAFRELTGESTKGVKVELPPNGTLEIPKLHSAAVADAQPVKPRVEVEFYIRKLSLDHNIDFENKLAKLLSDGWIVKREEFKAFEGKTQPEVWYVARLERVSQ